MSVQGTAIVIPHTVDQANPVHINDYNSEEGNISTEANTRTSIASTDANTNTSTASLKVKNYGLEFEIETTPYIPALYDYERFTKKDRLSMKQDKLNDVFECMIQGLNRGMKNQPLAWMILHNWEESYDLGTIITSKSTNKSTH